MNKVTFILITALLTTTAFAGYQPPVKLDPRVIVKKIQSAHSLATNKQNGMALVYGGDDIADHRIESAADINTSVLIG